MANLWTSAAAFREAAAFVCSTEVPRTFRFRNASVPLLRIVQISEGPGTLARPEVLIRSSRWESLDIKVDTTPYFTPDLLFDGVEFDELVDEDPKRTQVNRFYLQLHNRAVGRTRLTCECERFLLMPPQGCRRCRTPSRQAN